MTDAVKELPTRAEIMRAVQEFGSARFANAIRAEDAALSRIGAALNALYGALSSASATSNHFAHIPPSIHAPTCAARTKEKGHTGMQDCDCDAEIHHTSVSAATADFAQLILHIDGAIAGALDNDREKSRRCRDLAIQEANRLCTPARAVADDVKLALAHFMVTERDLLNWITDQVNEGRGNVEFCLTDGTGRIGVFCRGEPLCRGAGNTAAGAIQNAIERQERFADLRRTPTGQSPSSLEKSE